MHVAVDVVGPVAFRIEPDPLAQVSGLEELSVNADGPSRGTESGRSGDSRGEGHGRLVGGRVGRGSDQRGAGAAATTVSLMPVAQAETAALLLASPAEEAYHQ